MIVALVPMKHVSRRVPGKNYRPFNGRPLYTYILGTLEHCEYIDNIVVNTDSIVLRRSIPKTHKGVLILPRPPVLCGDYIPMNDILLHDVLAVRADLYIQTHSTNPLLSAITIDSAIHRFNEVRGEYDSLFGVTRIQSRLWDWQSRPINHNPEILLNTQDLQPVYEENSCIYIFTRESLRRKGNRIGERPYLFEIDAIEAMDIDTLLDFKVAEALHRERLYAKKNTDLVTPITAGTS